MLAVNDLSFRSNKNLADILASLDKSCQSAAMFAGSVNKIAWDPETLLGVNKENYDQNKINNFIKAEQFKSNTIFGFINYELGNYLQKIKPAPKSKQAIPLIYLLSYSSYLQQNDDKFTICSSNAKFITQAEKAISSSNSYELINLKFKPKFNDEHYSTAYNKIKNYISAGDIYQVNLTHPLVDYSTASSKQIMANLASKSRAKMMSYIQLPEVNIISLSPERFIKINDRHIQTEPIKGTVKGISTRSIDKLTSNLKEIAELSMITDLLRNDLSVVCRPKSVKIKASKQTTRLKNISHTYSIIEGKLNDKITSFEALLSMFPGGSVTGVPKNRAMKVISEVEDYSRQAYCGSMFVIEPNGNLEANILIRTITQSDSHLVLPVGGGIVFDSDLKNEYQETLAKADSFI